MKTIFIKIPFLFQSYFFISTRLKKINARYIFFCNICIDTIGLVVIKAEDQSKIKTKGNNLII